MRQALDDVTGDGQRQRAAAIAAMGQRLAAAGPRTRQRVTKRYNPSAEPYGDTADEASEPRPERAPALVADRSHAFIRDIAPILPPSPRQRAFTMIGRTLALATMAAAGFAAVLLAQSPRWSAGHRAAPKQAAASELPKFQPPVQSVAPPQMADNTAPTPPVARAPAVPPQASPAAPPATPAAMPRPAAPPPAPARAMPVQLAVIRPAAQPVRMAVHGLAPRFAAQRRAMLARISLPRWLTDPRDDPPRTIIMSPPPHDLEAPPQSAALASQMASHPPGEQPGPVLPPLPRPRLVYASATYPPPAPTRAPPYAPYGGTYAYPASPYGYQAQPYAP